MRILICIIMLILGGCCHTQTKVPCPEIAIKQVQNNISDTKQQVSDAWTEAENEEIVSAIEKSDSTRWTKDLKRNVLLAEAHDVNVYSHKSSSHVFFRVTIFSDGILFLDSEERSMSSAHKTRLVLFYDMIVFVGR